MIVASSTTSTPHGTPGAEPAEQAPSGPEEIWQGLVAAWDQLVAFGLEHWKEALVVGLAMLMLFLFIDDASSGRL